jgi:gluconolactonase
MKRLLILVTVIQLVACKQESQQTSLTISVERIEPGLDAVIDKELTVSVIATGYEWSEGPLWLEGEKKLLFSDVPTNTVYQWTEQNGASVYLNPSGFTGEIRAVASRAQTD